jgi:glutathione synthase/RimK-type ligase-like ATP-grasp enzyme
MKQPLAHIGTTELIDLPDYALDGVPAKIDTGADSSAIWASNIVEDDGILSFVLFGASSLFYSGQTIKTDKYTKVTVKNSFGHAEQRYRTDIKVRLGQKTIKVKMNLANRSTNRYPVLIGKRTLRNKFVVDVSRQAKPAGNQKILLLTAKRTDTSQAYASTLGSYGLEVDQATFEELLFCLSNDGSRIEISGTGQDIANYSLIYFRTSLVYGNSDVSAAIAQYLSDRNVDYIDRSVIKNPDPKKLYQYVVLADNRINIPKTLFMLPVHLMHNYEKIIAEVGSPFILKDINGRRGQYNYLIDSKADFDRANSEAGELNIWLLAQQYIPNDYVYRLITLGGQLALAIRRGRDQAGGHLYSTSRGSKVELIEPDDLPARLSNIAPMSAKLMGLQIAGVDFVQDKETNIWYCLEVNKAPQLYSGSFVEEKEAAVARYLKHRLFGEY